MKKTGMCCFIFFTFLLIIIISSACNTNQASQLSPTNDAVLAAPDVSRTPTVLRSPTTTFEPSTTSNESVIHHLSDYERGTYLVLMKSEVIDELSSEYLDSIVLRKVTFDENGAIRISGQDQELLKMVEGLHQFSAALNSDGTRLVLIEYGNGATDYLLIVDLRSASTERVEFPRRECYSPTWSPNNDQMLMNCLSDDGMMELFLLTLEDQHMEQFTDCGADGMACIWGDWSPDGKYIAFIKTNDGSGYHDTGLYVIPTTCLQDPQTCMNFEEKVSDDTGYLRWVSQNESIYTIQQSGFQRCDFSSSDNFICEDISLDGVEEFVDVPSFYPSRDGKYLFFMNSHPQIVTYSIETHEMMTLGCDRSIIAVLGEIEIH